MRKKLLYLLLVVLMLSLTACYSSEPYQDVAKEEESVQTTDESTQTTDGRPAVTADSYETAIKFMFNTLRNDFTKEELRAMYPEACWTHFAEEKGKSFDDIYVAFSKRMAEDWKEIEENVGEGADIKYELLDRRDYQGEAYEELKANLGKKFGIDHDSFGICYEVQLKKAVVGKQQENIFAQVYHVMEIDGKWYVYEVLTNLPVV